MSKERKSREAGRDSGTGRFKPVEKARRDKEGSTVERLPLPGHGTEGKRRK